MRKFRNNHPTRTYTGVQKSHYTEYKNELRKDFNFRCGYTDCLDIWWGDGFHIDHFSPRKPNIADPVKLGKFTAREHLYTNLIYACPQVNRAKGNDWASDDPDVCTVGDKGYFDPCAVDFNIYFERLNAGGIVPKDHPIARYMWIKLKLYLKRYEIYWRLEQIFDGLDELISLKNKLELPDTIKEDVSNQIVELTEEYMKYFKYLQINYVGVVR